LNLRLNFGEEHGINDYPYYPEALKNEKLVDQYNSNHHNSNLHISENPMEIYLVSFVMRKSFAHNELNTT
jgi:hypothetical protein